MILSKTYPIYPVQSRSKVYTMQETIKEILSYGRPTGYNLIFIPKDKYESLEEVDKEELRRHDPYERVLNHSEMGLVRAVWIHPKVADRMIDKYSAAHGC